MGVKSFDSFIRQRVAGEPLTLARSDQPRCFVVDGNGFLYYLYNARQLDVWHGVDPSAIKSAVEWFIQPFRDSNVTLLFVFDGANEPHKAATHRSRREQIVQQLSLLMHNLASAQYQVDQVELQNPSQLMPCNALPALKSALDQHDGCIVVCADGEADSLIAQISCQFQCTAVMAQDSDFFFARLSMPESLPATIYIPFDTLRFVENASTITVRAQSWTRDRIAAFLNLSCQTSTPTATFDDDTQVAHALLSHLFRAKVMPEYQLLACLVGNDWTLPAQWLGEFHQRLSTHGLSDISAHFRRNPRTSQFDAHGIIRGVHAWLHSLRTASDKFTVASLRSLLFGARTSAAQCRRLAAELHQAVLQYDDAAIDSSMVWQVLSERGLVPRDHADLIALASPSSMVAIDGHAIHPALRELHFKGKFPSSYFTVLLSGQNWLPIYPASCSKHSCPLHETFSSFRAQVYSLLFANPLQSSLDDHMASLSLSSADVPANKVPDLLNISEHILLLTPSKKPKLANVTVKPQVSSQISTLVPSAVPPYHHFFEMEIDLQLRQELFLGLFGLKVGNHALLGSCDAMHVVCIAACITCFRRQDKLLAASSSSSSTNDIWTSNLVLAAFALSRTLDSAPARFSFNTDAHHALHAIDSMSDIMHPANVLLGAELKCVNGSLSGPAFHRCFDALNKVPSDSEFVDWILSARKQLCPSSSSDDQTACDTVSSVWQLWSSLSATDVNM